MRLSVARLSVVLEYILTAFVLMSVSIKLSILHENFTATVHEPVVVAKGSRMAERHQALGGGGFGVGGAFGFGGSILLDRLRSFPNPSPVGPPSRNQEPRTPPASPLPPSKTPLQIGGPLAKSAKRLPSDSVGSQYQIAAAQDQGQDGPAYPSCVVDTEMRTITASSAQVPDSWERLKRLPTDENSGSCYPKRVWKMTRNSIIDNGQCCCSYWEGIKPNLELQRLFDFGDSAKESCHSSFHMKDVADLFAKRALDCDYAVSLSGTINRAGEPLCVLESLELEGLLGPRAPKACAFIHARVAAGVRLKRLISILKKKVYVAGVELERDTPKVNQLVTEAVQKCNEGSFGRLIENLRFRNGEFNDAANVTLMHMYRRIWLAHRMARRHEMQSGGSLRYIARARIDQTLFNAGFNWTTIDKLTGYDEGKGEGQRAQILIGNHHLRLNRSKRLGVPYQYRCIANDQLAAGPAHLMDGYASVFPDFKDFVRTYLITRPDQNGHLSERTMATHLHYRGVEFTEIPTRGPIHTYTNMRVCAQIYKFKGLDPPTRR